MKIGNRSHNSASLTPPSLCAQILRQFFSKVSFDRLDSEIAEIIQIIKEIPFFHNYLQNNQCYPMIKECLKYFGYSFVQKSQCIALKSKPPPFHPQLTAQRGRSFCMYGYINI